MTTLTDRQAELLKAFPKAIVHLRHRFDQSLLGPVFGAGVSRDLQLPAWDKLIEKIKSHEDVNGGDIVTKDTNLATKVQLLFQHYCENFIHSKGKHNNVDADDQQEALTSWMKIVHCCLYDGTAPYDVSVDSHPYLKSLLELIRKSPLTITYNFDNAIEYALDTYRREGDPKRDRGAQTITDAAAQFRKDIPVIFHPNGYLPRNFGEYASETIVFSDESFADQLIHSMSGQFSSLLNHFIRNTCLFIGLSLEDSTLRHLLRQSATMCPGHYHYFVFYENRSSAVSPEQKKAIVDANFDVYNLITLFLDGDGIRALADLISIDGQSFEEEADRIGVNTKFVYYLLGSVGVGKSTSLAHLRTLFTYDEWLDAKPAAMLRSPDTITPEERKEADVWINDQFRKKNLALKGNFHGIHVADRCPLDPLSFHNESDWKTRAQSLLESVKDTAEGQPIVLTAGPNELLRRLRRRHKRDWSEDSLNKLQEKMDKIYGLLGDYRIVHTEGKPIRSVVQEISRVIHLSEYEPVDIQQVLYSFASNGGLK